MHPRAAEFERRATERYGLDVGIEEFPEGTKTAADAADAVGCDVAQIASSIVMLAEGAATATDPERAGGHADGEPVVVVTSGANRVDEGAVASVLDADSVAMADAETIRGTLGWSIGGVPPICHDSEVPVLFDPTLTEFETVWAAAGTPTAVFPIDPERLKRLANATESDVTG